MIQLHRRSPLTNMSINIMKLITMLMKPAACPLGSAIYSELGWDLLYRFSCFFSFMLPITIIGNWFKGLMLLLRRVRLWDICLFHFIIFIGFLFHLEDWLSK